MRIIEDIEALEALYDAAVPTSLSKVAPALTPLYRHWIGASRFCVLATVGPDGTDASPRGDDGPVVRIADDRTLWLPDWRGNSRLDGLRNIVSDGRVSLMFMVPLSLGMALTLRVSFLVGARAPDTARLISRSSLLLAGAIALVFASGLWLGSGLVAQLYTSDPEVQAVTIALLLWAALFQIVDVIQVTCISALRGYKDTRIPMLIMLFSFWGVSLPLGYVLTFTDSLVPAMGAAGFWIGLTAGLTSASVLLMTRLFLFTPERSDDQPATVTGASASA